jgi:lon-related putative ATP-dependent protease
MPKELTPGQVRRTCDPAGLGFTSTEELPGSGTIIGQDRAVQSLQFGLGILDPGFNIYVSGLPGTGRTTAVNGFLQAIAQERPVPDDWCYLHSFGDPYRPQALRLPPGQARELRADMKNLVTSARRDIRSLFESDNYAASRLELEQGFQAQRDETFGRLESTARDQGFQLESTATGLRIIPVQKDKPLSEEEFAGLPDAQRDQIVQKSQKLQEQIEAAIRHAKRIERSASEGLAELDQKVARFALGALTADLKEKYAATPQVLAYLDQVQEDILQRLELFKGETEGEPSTPAAAPEDQQDPFRRYEVNLLVDNTGHTGAPVIIETNPTYPNLFGRIEQEMQFGVLTTDFTLIRGGTLHRANGGYLVLPVDELLRNPFAWDGLKRALDGRQVTIEDTSERLGVAGARSMQPAPIPLRIKVVLIGQPEVYHLLRGYDESFGELFKVKAEFDTQMSRTDDAVGQYATFASTICRGEGLKHLDAPAVARLVEHGSRLVQDQQRLSTHFGKIADVIREASHYASQEGSALVGARHITEAIRQSLDRVNLAQSRIREMVERGIIRIDTSGASVGQVNGLSVLSLGDLDFGQPSRISVTVSAGRDGVTDIEREAKLGGSIHTKGILILTGFFAGRYAQQKPLTLSARLVFEQSYGEVDGDSASSAELYALLSGLSGVPIRQGIAVTGSIDQQGRVQAIGGVNEKVEGFFDVCRSRGLTGDQGVIIPEANAQDLMLRDDVVEAVAAGSFHVWTVATIDEGIEILTGMPAGAAQADGSYPADTINRLVCDRLAELSASLRDEEDGEQEAKAGEGEPAAATPC